MSAAVPLDANASRPQSGFLTPSSDGSLNRHDGRPEAGQKRKRVDSVAMDQLLRPSIAVKPHPANLQTPPRPLLPLMLVPREHISLSYFDLGSSQGEFPQSRFYESHVKILDLESRMGSRQSVLVARNESKGTCYALERQETGLYVLCKLGSWVDISILAEHATVLVKERLQRPKTDEGLDTKLFAAEPRLTESQRAKRQAIESIQSLVRKRARTLSVSLSSSTIKPEGQAESKITESLPAPGQQPSNLPHTAAAEPTLGSLEPRNDPGPEQDADKIYDNVRTQYFEALYKSKGSLAYFAKGPLSRARSTFALDLDSTLDIADLVEFLKSLILTTVQIDKKYRETVPEVIASMKQVVDSADDGRKKKRRPRKMKLGKDGLYPLEDDSVRQWWTTNKPELTENEPSVSQRQIKTHVSMLRTRETLLQMILIMEIIALEPKAAEQATQSLPSLPGAADSQSSMAPPLTKKRNKHNLPVLIDVHADRLTIWQSTASDELLLLEDSQAPEAAQEHESLQKTSEPLKDFCVDVVIPFFSARLPEICDALSRKLGGPVIIAKAKSKPRRDQKPGAVTKRVEPRREMSLQRALSFEQQHHRRSLSRGPNSALALMRSASAVSIPTLKRENSEPPRPGSKAGSDGPKPRMGTLSRSSSMANMQDVRATKKAKVEAELKDAISALRKPNRDVVSKSMAEEAVRKATSQPGKKPRKPMSRPSLGQGVQVKATPANNRFKDMMGSPTLMDTPLPSLEEIIPPSSIGLVPSTVQRTRQINVPHSSASPAGAIGSTPVKASTRAHLFDRPVNRHSISATPVKAATSADFLRRPAAEEPVIPPSSPIMARQAPVRQDAIFQTPMKRGPLFATPTKPSVTREDAALRRGSYERTQETKTSIFERLGWDDDMDDLL